VEEGDVFVYATGRSTRAAVWGELISAACLNRRVVGVVTDGLARDTRKIRDLGFPVFCCGSLPTDVHGRLEVAFHGRPVEIDGVQIRPGDLIVADDDGVVIIPAEVESAVLKRCIEKYHEERRFLDAVSHGMGAEQAFGRFKVL
jgi:regulator of RNase E activity RraA